MALRVQIPEQWEQDEDCPLLLAIFDFNWHFQSIVTRSPSSSAASSPRDLIDSFAFAASSNDDERQELFRVFKAFDANDDGLVCKEEVRTLMSKLGGHEVSEEELDLLMLSVDLNGDGCIDFDEFYALYNEVQHEDEGEEGHADSSSDDDEPRGSKMKKRSDPQELRDAFRMFDKNDDGFITAEELHTVLSKLGFVQGGQGVAACRKMIRGVDSNGDGLVDFDEFKNMMLSRPSPRAYFANEAVC